MVKLATSTLCCSFPCSVIFGTFATFYSHDSKTKTWFKNTSCKSSHFAIVFRDVAKFGRDKAAPVPSWALTAKDKHCLYFSHQH